MSVSERKRYWTWQALFDVAEMDNVCETVQSEINYASLGERSGMGKPLRKYLIAPLDDYIAEHWVDDGQTRSHVSAAERFRDSVERLAEDFEEHHCFDSQMASSRASALRFAWLEFIAYGAAHLMAWKAPRDREQRIRAAKQPRKPASRLVGARGIAGFISQDPTAKRSTQVLAFAEAMKVSETTVWRWVKRAKELKLLP